MIEIRFLGDTKLDGIQYRAGDVVTLDSGRAGYCIDNCWAVDNVTGRAGVPKDGPVVLEIDDLRQDICNS